MNIKRLISCAIGTLIAASVCTISTFAEDFSFDMTKARPTYGGGQAYSMYTRLDNERRDKYNFNPLWITEDSTFEVEYTTEGEYIDAPIRLIFQSWEGKLVESKEDKWIQIVPTSFDDTKAIWDYNTITATYGSDFSDVYCLVLGDGETNSLTVTSMTAFNLNIPEEDMYSIKNGIVLNDGEPITIPESETTEKQSAKNEQSAETITEAIMTEQTENTSETTIATSFDEPKNTETSETSSEKEEQESEKSVPFVIYLILPGILAVILVILLIRNRIKAAKGGWR